MRSFRALFLSISLLGLSHDSLFFTDPQSIEIQNTHISLSSWERQLDGIGEHSNIPFEPIARTEERILSETILPTISSEMAETILEIEEGERFADRIRIRLESVGIVKLTLTEDFRPYKDHQNEPVPKRDLPEQLFSIPGNQIVSKSNDVAVHLTGHSESHAHAVKSIGITLPQNVPYINKKLMKYYSIRRNAPPFGEQKC